MRLASASPDARADAAGGVLSRPLLAGRVGPLLACLLGIGFALLWTWLTLRDHVTFHDTNRDVAIYTQVLWNTAQGRPFQTTALINNTSHLAEHVAPLLLVLAPWYGLAPAPGWLMLLQQVALALAGAPVYLLARRRLGGTWAPLALLASFYLAPALAEVATQDFHPVAFAAIPLGWGAYYALTGRPGLGALLALPTLALEETSALALFGLGLLLLLRRETRPGVGLVAVSAAWLALATLVVMPAFHLPETLAEVAGNRTLHKFRDVLHDPGAAVADLTQRAPDTVRWWLLPNGGLALLAPQTLVAALPTAGVLLLNHDPNDLFSHRPAPALPLTWLAAAEGLAWLASPWQRRAGLAALLVGTALAYRLDSRLPGGGHWEPSQVAWTARSETLQRAVELVPPGASLGATSDLADQLADRERLYVFPAEYSRALWPPRGRLDWWALDVSKGATQRDLLQKPGSPLLARPPYDLWLLGDDALLAADAFPPLASRGAADVQFGDALRLEGLEARPSAQSARFDILLDWRVLQAPGRDYTRHLEVLGADGAVLGAQDGPASRAYFGTARWLPGRRVREQVSVQLPSGAAPLRLRIGWTDARGGEPLPVAGTPGAPSAELPLP